MTELLINSSRAERLIAKCLRDRMTPEQQANVQASYIVRRLLATMSTPDDRLPKLRIDSTVAQRRIAECLRETMIPTQANTLASEIVGRLMAKSSSL